VAGSARLRQRDGLQARRAVPPSGTYAGRSASPQLIAPEQVANIPRATPNLGAEWRTASVSLAYPRRTTSDPLAIPYRVPSGSLCNTYTTPSEHLVNTRRMRENHAYLRGAGHRRQTANLERRAGKTEHPTSNIQRLPFAPALDVGRWMFTGIMETTVCDAPRLPPGPLREPVGRRKLPIV
jgi:hypothetical protein